METEKEAYKIPDEIKSRRTSPSSTILPYPVISTTMSWAVFMTAEVHPPTVKTAASAQTLVASSATCGGARNNR